MSYETMPSYVKNVSKLNFTLGCWMLRMYDNESNLQHTDWFGTICQDSTSFWRLFSIYSYSPDKKNRKTLVKTRHIFAEKTLNLNRKKIKIL